MLVLDLQTEDKPVRWSRNELIEAGGHGNNGIGNIAPVICSFVPMVRFLGALDKSEHLRLCARVIVEAAV